MKQSILSLSLALAALLIAAPSGAQDALLPLEHEKVSVTTSEGFQLAGYVTRPREANAALPALFLTQWVSCGSIAPRDDRNSIEERLAHAASYALIRVDRSGSGESEGPGCDQLDYDTEVRHYREALDRLSMHPWIDSSRIVVIGSSLGSTTAPLVALGKQTIGVTVQGAGALTYLERMIHFDRIQLERQKEFDPLTIDREMRRRMEFHRHYLHSRMTPAQIEAQHPELAGVWESLVGTDAAPHYGRPHAWHWQAAEKDWLAAWASLDVPVMVVYGGFEQFESRHGHRTIVDTINRLRPGTASWLEIPDAGHGLRIYPDPVSAYAWEGGERRPELFIEPVAAWLREIAAGAATD